VVVEMIHRLPRAAAVVVDDAESVVDAGP